MRTITREAYSGDIVSRLRNWRGLHLAHGGELFEEAAAEIERLRLTDEEREAVANGASSLEAEAMRPRCGESRVFMRRHAATLRSLLERLS